MSRLNGWKVRGYTALSRAVLTQALLDMVRVQEGAFPDQAVSPRSLYPVNGGNPVDEALAFFSHEIACFFVGRTMDGDEGQIGMFTELAYDCEPPTFLRAWHVSRTVAEQLANLSAPRPHGVYDYRFEHGRVTGLPEPPTSMGQFMMPF